MTHPDIVANSASERDLPEGYRWMVVGEALNENDGFWSYVHKAWIRTAMAGHQIGGADSQLRYVRRVPA